MANYIEVALCFNHQERGGGKKKRKGGGGKGDGERERGTESQNGELEKELLHRQPTQGILLRPNGKRRKGEGKKKKEHVSCNMIHTNCRTPLNAIMVQATFLRLYSCICQVGEREEEGKGKKEKKGERGGPSNSMTV